MDLVLVGIAGVSLFLALAMGAVLLSVLDEERRRSNARVALLAAAVPAPPPPADAPELDRIDLHRDAIPLQGVDAGGRALFDPVPAASPWQARLAVAGALCVVLLAGIFLFGGSDNDRRDGAATVSATAPAAPLELLALRHTQDARGLTISGIVANPRGAAARRDVAATVLAIGGDGSVLATGTSGIDIRTLDPGAESPFVVRVPIRGAVAKYRVAFRTADGRAVSHVDRRTDLAPAAAAEQARTGGTPPWDR